MKPSRKRRKRDPPRAKEPRGEEAPLLWEALLQPLPSPQRACTITDAHTCAPTCTYMSRYLRARTLTLSVSVSGVNGVGSSGPSEYMEVPLGSLELPSEGTLSPNHAGNCQLLG